MKQFTVLREKIHREIEAETAKCIKQNRKPTTKEILVGAFREMIEPQVRDAVFEFYGKGYVTESSGFAGKHGEIQFLDGYFAIDQKSKTKIEALGAKVLKGKDIGLPGESKYYTHIIFKPKIPDLNKIKTKWDTIAKVLPKKNIPLQPSISAGSEDFRKEYAIDRTDVERTVLQRRLALDEYSPETVIKMKKRLKELT